MSNKTDVKQFIYELLTKANCRNVHDSGGRDLSCSCPFHNPRKNSSAFGVSYIKEDELYPYHCYSCGERGNIFKLIAYLNKCNLRKARKIFKKRVLLEPLTLEHIKEEYNKLISLNKEYVEDTEVQLPHPAKNQSPMYDYLEWRSKVKQHNLLDIDWIVERYDLYYTNDKQYAGRIIMPIKDVTGEIITFNNRSIKDDAKVKTKHVLGVNITNYIHGLYQAIGHEMVIIVEGPMDMFQVLCALKKRKIHDFGVVCIMGTHVDYDGRRVELLAQFFDKAYIFFDNDKTGRTKSYKVEWILSNVMNVVNITKKIPYEKDPAICRVNEIVKAIYKENKLNVAWKEQF